MAYDYIKAGTWENDYVERNGSVDELTVTITLSEYRELIRTDIEQRVKIARLENEAAELRKQLDNLRKVVIAKNPHSAAAAVNAIREMFAVDDENEEDEADETAGGN